MYGKAKGLMTERRLTLKMVASKMKIGISTLSQKLNGKSPFTLNEAKKFKEVVGTDLSLEELFTTEAS